MINLSIIKKKYILCLLTGIFIFRILYNILDINISYSLIISFLGAGILYILIKGSKIKEGGNWSGGYNRGGWGNRVYNRWGSGDRWGRWGGWRMRGMVFPVPEPIKIPPPVNEYTEDEQKVYNILNNAINPTLQNFDNNFKRLHELARYETEDEFSEFLRDTIRPQLKNIQSMYETVNTSLIKRASDTRLQDNEQGVKIPFYNKETWDDQHRQERDIKSKINTFHSQIKGFIQKIKHQKQEEESRYIHVKPIPPVQLQDEYTYIPPSSSYLSNYSNNKYINQYV